MAALRAVLASDFMTAAGAELPYALLKKRAAASLAKRAAIWREGLQAVKRGVLRLGAFVAVGTMAAVQVPAADDRAGPQRSQQGQLLFS